MDSTSLHSALNSSVDAQNRFALQLFCQLYQLDQNILISPPIIATSLAMLWNGACGDTRNGIAQALSLTDIDQIELNRNYQLLQKQLHSDAGVEIHQAQALWAKPDICFHANFLQQLTEFYHSEPHNISSIPSQAIAEINAWASRQTEGKISHLIDQLDESVRIILLSAIYFKGQWQEKFSPDNTHVDLFLRDDGYAMQVDMMTQTSFFHAIYEPGFEALRLPYLSNQFAMYLFLPDADSSLPEFFAKLNQQNWHNWREKLQTGTEVNLSIMLPRFQLDYQTELSEPLTALGMALAFDTNQADFGYMVSKSEIANLHLHAIKQQAFMEVNEAGTTAAAVAASLTRATGIPGYLVFNRPFLLAIVDERNGNIIFLGTVNRPNDNPPLTESEVDEVRAAYDRHIFSQFGPFYKEYQPKHHRELKMLYAQPVAQTSAQSSASELKSSETTTINHLSEEVMSDGILSDPLITAEMEQLVLSEIKELSVSTVILLMVAMIGIFLGDFLGRQLGELLSYHAVAKMGWSLPSLTTLLAVFVSNLAGMVMLAVGFFCYRVVMVVIYQFLDYEVPPITVLQTESTRLLYIFILILFGLALGVIIGWPLSLLCGKLFGLVTGVTFIQLASLLLCGLLLPPIADQNRFFLPDS